MAAESPSGGNLADELELGHLPRRRQMVNSVTRWIVGLGGAAVIGAIALIFFYLLWVVAPILSGAEMTDGVTRSGVAPGTLLAETDDNSEFAFLIDTSGEATFVDLDTGTTVATETISDEPLISARRVAPSSGLYALELAGGGIAFVEIAFEVSFDENERSVLPIVTPAFDGEPLRPAPMRAFDLYRDGSTFTFAGLTEDGDFVIEQYEDVEVDLPLEFPEEARRPTLREYERIIIGPRGNWVYLLAADGHVEVLDISVAARPRQLFDGRIVHEDRTALDVQPLLGRQSLLVADDAGVVTQWFVVRDEFGYHMTDARRFELDAPIVRLVPERRRKGFAAIDGAGVVHLAYSTSGKVLARHETRLSDVSMATFAPRANRLVLANADGDFEVLRVDNPHPEIAWSTLWQRVWYEGYPEPVLSWQSSSADTAFEPKFSLTPLAFGTLKAAFYAMLFAMPIAIMGAMYTAFFMAPSMRRWVKPGIEIMAALPTVILGFLAGLWLAPLVETHLTAVLSLLVFFPVTVLAFAWGWHHVPRRLTGPLAGWYAAVSVPLIVGLGIGVFAAGPAIEAWLFDGAVKTWFREQWGLEYDQRNALVVGVAMGLAVIPTIFSISEDAIYGVPRHLVNGSLALGASSWQTLTRVVLLTASPGIFSAVMIGFGRAVGETMIVLMATGNTAVMDLNIFEGMRTFAANIAVELPESEVASTHYRILFLAALVLFLLTFLFNTAAELIRQRLRVRYGNL